MKKFLIAAAIFTISFGAVAGDRVRGHIVGIGSDSSRMERLYERGWDAALFEVKACGITGKFSNGSRCYVVYETGWSEYVNAMNRPYVAAFYMKLLELRKRGIDP